MKKDYTLTFYKPDRRCTSGKRAVSITYWSDRTMESMLRECAEVYHLYPKEMGYTFEIT